MFNLTEKKVLITGATGGIGNSLVEKFYSEKSLVIATGTNNEKLDNLKNKFPKLKTINFSLDKHSEIENFIENVHDQFNGLDIVINNAGITKDNLSIRMKDEEWKRVIDLNLTSTFLICKFSIKKFLKQKKGKIINITSIVGHTGNVGQTNYTASKAGIVAFSKSLSLEYSKKNININCISPGFIKTEMTEKIPEEYRKVIEGKISCGKLGDPLDVTNCALFLASDLSDYIHGETIHVNGGMYMA